MQHHLSFSEVIQACKQRAFDYQARAVQVRTAGDRDKDLEYSAKAQALNQLVEELVGAGSANPELVGTGEIDAIARQLDPQLFNSFDTYINKLRHDGHDDGYVIRAAEAVYGEAISEARAKARQSLSTSPSDSNDAEASYGRGIEDAIAWHERHARQADIMEARETLPEKKVKFRKRAARHRLYANTMRTDFANARAQRIQKVAENAKVEASQASLFPADSHVPLDVQRAFLRRPGEMLDEA